MASPPSKPVRPNRRTFSLFYDRYASRLWGLLLEANLPGQQAEAILCTTLSEAWKRLERHTLSEKDFFVWLVSLACQQGMPHLTTITSPEDDLDALGRIVMAIKTYRYRPLYSHSISKEAYLQGHLSGEDWRLWQRLQVKGTGILLAPNGTDIFPKSYIIITSIAYTNWTRNVLVRL
jgi:hypothetical protein